MIFRPRAGGQKWKSFFCLLIRRQAEDDKTKKDCNAEPQPMFSKDQLPTAPNFLEIHYSFIGLGSTPIKKEFYI